MANDLVTLTASVLFHKKSVKTLWDAMGSASWGKLDVEKCHLKGKEAAKGEQRQLGYFNDLLLENQICKNYISITISLNAETYFIYSKMHFFSFTFYLV